MEKLLEIQAREIQDLPLAEKQEKALDAVSEFASLARRTVEQAWLAGKWLTAVKTELGHGSWLPWLNENGIEPRTAQRFMKLAAVEIRQVIAFDSMDATLKALKTDPLAGPKEKAIKLISAAHEILFDQAEAAWHLGQALSKIADLEGDRGLAEFVQDQNMPKKLVVTARDLFERYSLETLSALSAQQLEPLVVVS